MTDTTRTARSIKYRAKHKPVSLRIVSPDAIKALKSLALRYGSQRAAIEAALIRLEKET
jgi:hypothetical protein